MGIINLNMIEHIPYDDKDQPAKHEAWNGLNCLLNSATVLTESYFFAADPVDDVGKRHGLSKRG